jgi:hypothetical protein
VDDYESLSHTKWDCKYHVVFIPKYRRKVLYGELRQGQECDPLGTDVWREEAQFRGTELLGQRVLRIDGRSRRSSDTGIHQEPGTRR